MKILVTGAAGFIGAASTRRLLNAGHEVLGVDNLSDYYSVRLKEDRLSALRASARFQFRRLDVSDRAAVAELFGAWRPERVAHLAAQPGVRYSLQNPHAYVQSNLAGFVNVLEACRHHSVAHLLYASSSAVYGANVRLPYSETDRVDHPISLYGATKRANELFAHSYSHLFRLPTTGLRYFTVYGPWGRPDMSPSLFADAILNRKPVELFNEGKHERDFTYIDDAAEATVRALDWVQESVSPGTAPFRIFNVGTRQRVPLSRYIALLEENLGVKAIKRLAPKQSGDMDSTWADTTALERELHFAPATPIERGVAEFARWYLDYHRTRA